MLAAECPHVCFLRVVSGVYSPGLHGYFCRVTAFTIKCFQGDEIFVSATWKHNEHLILTVDKDETYFQPDYE